MIIQRPYVLDCTRLVAQAWTGRPPSGIDRVCHAYRTRFAARSHAAVQYRGKAVVLSPQHSDMLFELLEGPRQAFRARFAMFAGGAYAAGRTQVRGEGAIYLNVSHTDFDLDRHSRWIEDCGLCPVYLLHDLIPVLHPQWSTRHKVQRHSGRLRRALRTASGIIANSRTTADELRTFACREAINPPPIVSAPLAAADLPVTAHAPWHEAPYFVCVSTIEERKNHHLLLQVWQDLISELGDAAPRLVLIGQWGMNSQRVRQIYKSDPRLPRFVRICNNSTDEELARWLGNALALLAPSRAEGFGLPVAEALKLRVPVIASNLPAFREIGGDIATYLDPLDRQGWHDNIHRFVADGADRQRQLAALTYYRAPSWDDHFRTVEPWLGTLPGNAIRLQPRPSIDSGMRQAVPALIQGAAR